ncbi:MAG TPA: gamma-glutamyltransferase [Methylomirabilota bacterium]|nr:gamma-glutamyltransferase [Methylomirabilota bacterium]
MPFRLLALALLLQLTLHSATSPKLSRKGMVVAQDAIAADVGARILRNGGNAIDAAIATAFALAVTHPAAGNIGGGGFIVLRTADGQTAAYDFRETAPGAAHPEMFLRNGKYDPQAHHEGHRAVGVPGAVAGMWLAWTNHGKLNWSNLVAPAITLARDGFPISFELAESLRGITPAMRQYPAAHKQFTKEGEPYQPGDTLKQPDLARTLERIAVRGPDDFYRGETARLIVAEMQQNNGLITAEDLRAYRAVKRSVIRGTYRGFGIISMPPPSSGGVAIVQALNILEGYDLASSGLGAARSTHLTVEALRRVFAQRAQFLGDPDFNTNMPITKLVSKDHAADLRRSINPQRASRSEIQNFSWSNESDATTHLSVVDSAKNAVSLTCTLEASYGSKIVVTGAGFLLNNEIGDFNAAPGLTTTNGLIGSYPNLARPGKRMLSSMSPTILVEDGELFLVTGTPGGRTIISTVLQTIINTVDFKINAQDAVNAARFHHQWFPDQINFERGGLTVDTQARLAEWGHALRPVAVQGAAQVIRVTGDGYLEAGADMRWADSKASTVEEFDRASSRH